MCKWNFTFLGSSVLVVFLSELFFVPLFLTWFFPANTIFLIMRILYNEQLYEMDVKVSIEIKLWL